MKRTRKQSLLELERAVALQSARHSSGMTTSSTARMRISPLNRLEKEVNRRRLNRTPARSQAFDDGQSFSVEFCSNALPARVNLVARPASFGIQSDSFDLVEHFDQTEIAGNTPVTNDSGATTSNKAVEIDPPSHKPERDTTSPEADSNSDADIVAAPSDEGDHDSPPSADEESTSSHSSPGSDSVDSSLSKRPVGDRDSSQSDSHSVDRQTIDSDLQALLDKGASAPPPEKSIPVLEKPSTPGREPVGPKDAESRSAQQGHPTHEVFDRMRSTTANTFALGDYELAERVKEIDAEVAAEQTSAGKNPPEVGASTSLSHSDMLSDIDAISMMLQSKYDQENGGNVEPSDGSRAVPTEAPRLQTPLSDRSTPYLPTTPAPSSSPAIDQSPSIEPDSPEAPRESTSDAQPTSPGAVVRAGETDEVEREVGESTKADNGAESEPGSDPTDGHRSKTVSYEISPVYASDVLTPLDAAAAVLAAWRDQESVSQAALEVGEGIWAAYQPHFGATDPNADFLESWGLVKGNATDLSHDAVTRLLNKMGPVILFATSPQPRTIVVTASDSQDDVKAFQIFDPSASKDTTVAISVDDLQSKFDSGFSITLAPSEDSEED